MVASMTTENDLLNAIVAAEPPDYDPAVHVISKALAAELGLSTKAALDRIKRMARNSPEYELIEVRLDNGNTAIALARRK